MKIATLTALTLGLIGIASLARADEEKIPLKDLPRVVVDAVKARFPGAELTGAEKEVEDGKTTYEVALKDKGKTVEVNLTAEGKITAIETEISAKELPGPVAAAVDAKYPRSTIQKIEEVIEFADGKETKSYEVLLITDSKKTVEVVFAPDGKVLETEDK